MSLPNDFTEQNRKAFDELASSYDTKDWQKKIMEQVSDEIRQRLDWLGVQWADKQKGNEVKLLDYACGTGLISRALGPSVTQILGIDISPNMVRNYNTRVAEAGLPPLANMHAIEGNILDDASWARIAADPAIAAFDVAAICMGVHHFASPRLAIERLTRLLKPTTGVLLIVDLVKEVEAGDDDPSPDHPRRKGGAGHTIHPAHNGFVREEVRRMFEGAGLVDFGWDTCETRLLMKFTEEGMERTAFFARGTRNGE